MTKKTKNDYDEMDDDMSDDMELNFDDDYDDRYYRTKNKQVSQAKRRRSIKQKLDDYYEKKQLKNAQWFDDDYWFGSL